MMTMGKLKMKNAFILVLAMAVVWASDCCGLIRVERHGRLKLGDGQLDLDSFRTVHRRPLRHLRNSNIAVSIDTVVALEDVQNVTVTVTGITNPSNEDWIGVFSPSTVDHAGCLDVEAYYLETGDTSSLPLTCQYPVKFKYMKSNPGYLQCTESVCSGSVTFRIINIRTDILFVFFRRGLLLPTIAGQAGPISFKNPQSPLYGHLSSIDSSGSSMRLTWVSGGSVPQVVQYASGNLSLAAQTVISTVSNFFQTDMAELSPARQFGWHDPGFVHTAVLLGLSPSTSYLYKYGSASVGFTDVKSFKTPPAAGDEAVTFIMYGDMGKAERDNSSEHYVQPGSLSVIDAVTRDVNRGEVDLVLHIGDISYATGFLVEWDAFLEMIEPVASKISYMTAIGNHERDYPDSGSYYGLTDSGGEVGIPYYNYFQMPQAAQEEPWYSFELGPVHITIMSTEHDWTANSAQYEWIQNDFASVNRSRTPWLVFAGHRPMYSSVDDSLVIELLKPSVDDDFAYYVEPLLRAGMVDLALWGHVHNYERLCAVYQSSCLRSPSKDSTGLDVYSANDNSDTSAPVQAVIGMSGFSLDGFKSDTEDWSLVRISQFGYSRIQATATRLFFEFITAATGTVGDSFAIVKAV